jgi:hypothetical protein
MMHASLVGVISSLTLPKTNPKNGSMFLNLGLIMCQAPILESVGQSPHGRGLLMNKLPRHNAKNEKDCREGKGESAKQNGEMIDSEL